VPADTSPTDLFAQHTTPAGATHRKACISILQPCEIAAGLQSTPQCCYTDPPRRTTDFDAAVLSCAAALDRSNATLEAVTRKQRAFNENLEAV
jgi:hypothetical protein